MTSLDIKIKVKTDGEQKIQDIIDRIKALNKAMRLSDADPLKQLKKAFSDAMRPMRQIGEEVKNSVKAIEASVNTISTKLKSQATETASQVNAQVKTVSKNVSKEGDLVGEIGRRLQTQFIRGSTTVSLTVLTIFNKTAASWLATTYGAWHKVQNTGIGTFAILKSVAKKSLSEFNLIAKSSFSVLGENLLNAYNYLSSFTVGIKALDIALKSLVFPFAFQGSLVFFKALIKEYGSFISRITGFGNSTNQPLKETIGLVRILNEGLFSIKNTWFNLGKVVTFSLASFTGAVPLFFTAIPIFNSFFSATLSFFKSPIMAIGAKLGSARSQIGYIFLYAKELAMQILPMLTKFLPQILTVLPAILNISKGMSSLNHQANLADKEIKKLGKSSDSIKSDNLNALSRTKLPFSVQFQQFGQEAKVFLSDIINKINQLLLTIQKVFNVAEKDIHSIKLTANQATDGVLQKVGQSGKFLDLVFSKGSIKKSFKELENIDNERFTKSLQGAVSKSSSLVSPMIVDTIKTIDVAIEKIFQKINGKNIGKQINQQLESMVSLIQKIGESLSKIQIFKEQEALNRAVQKITELKNQALKIPAISLVSPVKNIQADKIKQQLDFGNILERKVTLGRQFGSSAEENTRIIVYFKTLVNSIETTLNKEFNPARFNKSIQTFLKSIGVGITGAEVPKDLVNKLSVILKNALDEGIKAGVKDTGKAGDIFVRTLTKSLKAGSPQELQSAVKAFLGDLQNVLATSINTKSSGMKISQQLAQGINDGKNSITNAAAQLAQEIMDHNPQSPAKKGALRNLVKSGSLIPAYLADGMRQGVKNVVAAAGEVTEEIAKHFPRSFPVLGALAGSALVVMGYKITFYIAEGITSGISLILRTLDSISEKMRQKISQASEFGFIAQRIGSKIPILSAFSSAFAQLGISTQEFGSQMVRIGDVLRRSITQEEMQVFSNLGIDIEAIRSSADPSIEGLLAISKSVKDFGINSGEVDKLLKAFGITFDSKFLNMLAKGTEALRGLANEAIKSGAVLSKQFVENAMQAELLTNKYNQIKEFFTTEFFAEILPVFNKITKGTIDFVNNNRATISGFIKTVSQVVAGLYNFANQFVKLLLENPSQTLTILGETLNVALEFINKQLDIVFELLKGSSLTFLNDLLFFFVNVPINVLTSFFPVLAQFLLIQLGKVGLNIWIYINKGFSDVVDWLAKFVGNLLDFIFSPSKWIVVIGDFFVATTKFIYNQLELLFLEAVKRVNTFLGDNVIMKKFLAFMGYDINVSGAADLNKQIDEIKEKLKNGSGVDIGGSFLKGVDKVLDVVSVDGAERALEGLKAKEKELGSFTTNLFKTAVAEAKKSAAEIAEDGKKAAKELQDKLPGAAEKTVENIKNKLEKLKEVFKGTSLEAPLKEMLEKFSMGNLQQNIEDAKKIQQELGGLLDNAVPQQQSGSGKISPISGENTRLQKEQSKRLIDLQLQENPNDLGAVEEKNNLELEEIRKRQQSELTDYEKFLSDRLTAFSESNHTAEEELDFLSEQRLAKEQFLADQQLEITKKTEQAKLNIIKQTLDLMANAASGIAGIFGDLFEMTGKKMKAFFFAQKAAALAEAIINTAVGITKAIPNPVMMGIAAVQGGIQQAKIIASTIQGFAYGGKVSGGSGTKDDVPALLMAGEYVQPKSTVQYYGAEVMEAIRQRLIPRDILANMRGNIPNMAYTPKMPKFADGGLVGTMQKAVSSGSQQQQSSKQPINLTTVNFTDREELAKFLASNAGRDIMLNVMQNNSSSFRQVMGS